MTIPTFLTTGPWAPAQAALHRADELLARVATRNAAAAIHLEAARRVEWRSEESEFLLMADTAAVVRSRPGA